MNVIVQENNTLDTFHSVRSQPSMSKELSNKMHRYIIVCVVLVLAPLFVTADDHDSKAIVFTKETFDSEVTQSKLFVMFYAPWCGHCKRLAPTWADLANEMNIPDSGVIIGQVDCTVEKDLCAAQGVRGYPTVKFFSLNAEGEKYSRQRTIEELRGYVQEQLGKKTEEPVKEEKKEEAEKKEPVETAKPTETGVYDLTDANFADHVASGHTFVKFFAPWCGHCKRLAPTWDELATNYKGNPKVTIAKVDCTVQKDTCSKFGVRGYPTIQWFTNGEKAADYREGRALPDLTQYIEKMSGTEAKKEPVKEEQKDKKKVPVEAAKPSEGGVYDLTDANFADHVAAGHTFVKFFAPWCGHCKRLAPTWDELATNYKGNQKVTIAKVDCTVQKDTCSKFGVRGYPTLQWFTNGQKSADYREGRTIGELSSFVEKMSSEENEEAKTSVDGKVPDGSVTLLNDGTFKSTIADDYTLVAFNPSSDDVKLMEQVAKSYLSNDEIMFATVDCTKSKSTCEEQKVSGMQVNLYHKGIVQGSFVGAINEKPLRKYLEMTVKGQKKDENMRDEL